jgi:hypothetical protein
MGYGMAMNIRKKIPQTSTLFITDVFRPACEKFRNEFSSYGAIEIVDTAREVAERAATVISIVPAAKDVKQVYLDSQNGIIAGKANSDRLMLECSTIDAQTAREVGETLLKANAGSYIDTPVSVCLQQDPPYQRTHTDHLRAEYQERLREHCLFWLEERDRVTKLPTRCRSVSTASLLRWVPQKRYSTAAASVLDWQRK